MVGTELECPKCATVAINRDFCQCGEYLGWELTVGSTEVLASDPPSYRTPAPAQPRVATLLTLRDPAREADDAGADVVVSVVPGQAVSVLATIRNQGEIVDTFDLRVEGLPAEWCTISSPTVFLNPWGTSGDYEQEVELRLHPPRTSAAEARAWPLTVVARSRSLDVDVAAVAAVLTVEPFQATVMQVGPERRHGRRHARFEVVVANHGNHPAQVAIEARDTEARCPVSVAPAHATVPVGATVSSLVLVGAPQALFFKRPVDHHVDVWHRVDGVESPSQRVAFRQKPWVPWWVPTTLALVAAFAAALLLLYQDPVVPKLEGDTVDEAVVVLKKRQLKLGRTSYAPAPKGVSVGSILAQEPAAGAELVKGEPVNITVAAPVQFGVVPDVAGLRLDEAAAQLKHARFGYDPQPATAGNDWVVIRQDPTPGTKHESGARVTLAVEQRSAPAAAATPTVTAPPPAPTVAAAAPASSPAAPAPAEAPSPPPPATARVAAKPKAKALPGQLIFAGATSGQLYRWDGKATARLTAARHRFQTPVAIDDGYAAVQVLDGARRLVRISTDGKTVTPIADGDFHRPAFSSVRGLLAVIDGSRLCVADPLEAVAPTCARTAGVSSPAWAPDGRSVLVVGKDGALRSFAAYGGDAAAWKAPKTVYRGARVRAAAWIDDDRVAVLLRDTGHLRVLARRGDGRLEAVKDLRAWTGHELAAAGDQVALRRGEAGDDGPMVLLDLDRAQPRVRSLPTGVDPAWVR